MVQWYLEFRDAWVRNIANWSLEQVVFLNESGVNSSSETCTHGWRLKSHIISYLVQFQNHANFSIFPTMTINCYIVCDVYFGGVNADTFNSFVEKPLVSTLQNIDPERY